MEASNGNQAAIGPGPAGAILSLPLQQEPLDGEPRHSLHKSAVLGDGFAARGVSDSVAGFG